MGRLASALVVIAVAASSAAAADPWQALRRPLAIPRLPAGAECPVSRARRVSDDFGLAQGPGPVYPIGAVPALSFVYPTTPRQIWHPSEWGGNKILWIARRAYRGPVLIRGRQLDGPNLVRFEGGRLPVMEMRLFPVGGTSPSGWQHRPSFTRLRGPGCYAWQVDGRTFSRVIVFRAVAVAAPR